MENNKEKVCPTCNEPTGEALTQDNFASECEYCKLEYDLNEQYGAHLEQ